MTVPNFLVIGAQKAASSWLTEKLRAHPDVFMPSYEVTYFTGENFGRGLAWYEQHFEDVVNESMIGEGTPGYIYRTAAPQRIADSLGTDLKLIASLRHPVDRAYSSFWRVLAGGELPHDADFLNSFLRDDFEIRSRGHYTSQVSRYLDVFPPDNFEAFVVERDLRDNSARTLERAFGYLGVDPGFVVWQADRRANSTRDMNRGHSILRHIGVGVAKRTANWNPAVRYTMRSGFLAASRRLPVKRRFVPLDAQLRDRLFNEYYRDELPELESLIDSDLSIWLSE